MKQYRPLGAGIKRTPLKILALLFVAALALQGCGGDGGYYGYDEDGPGGSGGGGGGGGGDRAKKASVTLTFVDSAEKPTSPSVGSGFKGNYGESVIMGGKHMFLSARKGTAQDSYPQLIGWIYDDLEVGKEIPLSQEAQAEQTGGWISYQLDDEKSWFATRGIVKIESTSPLKVTFKDIEMEPLLQVFGKFTASGTGTW